MKEKRRFAALLAAAALAVNLAAVPVLATETAEPGSPLTGVVQPDPPEESLAQPRPAPRAVFQQPFFRTQLFFTAPGREFQHPFLRVQRLFGEPLFVRGLFFRGALGEQPGAVLGRAGRPQQLLGGAFGGTLWNREPVGKPVLPAGQRRAGAHL